MKIIVSRHPGAIEFVRKHLPDFADAPVISQATENDVQGNEVVGNLPSNLAALASRYIAIEFPAGNAPRGQDYTLEDMENAGAQLVEYRVERIRVL
ncbi:CRISPR-associated protein Csx16 [Anaerolinea sp.]|uniref:CRISPR-associated protein Csx16 n=1 Tax=Anaerolinea sp. TaxID=1872519 RepID=UPI002ACDB022|nr:CRISPR-associated protein Csx16 [Anaerolinea sp.]